MVLPAVPELTCKIQIKFLLCAEHLVVLLLTKQVLQKNLTLIEKHSWQYRKKIMIEGPGLYPGSPEIH